MLTLLQARNIKRLCAATLMCLAPLSFADEHTHRHDGHNTAMPTTPGKKWETDAVVRQGMEAIRQLMAKHREGIEQDRLAPQDYKRLAEAVDQNVAGIVKNCKLNKETDAAFHQIVLLDLTNSTELMRASPKLQAQRAGALGVLQSLRNYGMYFQHPGWPVETEKAR